jgi:hypothetical protein
VGHFCPPGSGFGLDPDPQHWSRLIPGLAKDGTGAHVGDNHFKRLAAATTTTVSRYPLGVCLRQPPVNVHRRPVQSGGLHNGDPLLAGHRLDTDAKFRVLHHFFEQSDGGGVVGGRIFGDGWWQQAGQAAGDGLGRQAGHQVGGDGANLAKKWW